MIPQLSVRLAQNQLYNLRPVLSLGTVALRMHIILYECDCAQSDELVPYSKVYIARVYKL